MNTADSQDLCFASIADLGELLSRRELSPVELTQAVLDRIEQHNDEMHVFITITRDIALEQARQVERDIQSGAYKGPLHGIPIALKDNIATESIRTSCASMVAPDWIPDRDATAYARLRAAGAVLVGKTNLSEYGFSQNPAYPPPLNPWRADRTAGGSSSGSGVAVAAGMAHGALGTDTGGSVRHPAHVNGVVGFQGTYGRVSRQGVVPLSYSLDHVGVLTRTVADSALLMQAIAGHDPLDEHSSRVSVPDFGAQLGRGIRGMKIAYARGQTYEDVDSDIVSVMQAARVVFRDLGASIEEVKLPFVDQCVALYRAIQAPEISEIYYDYHRDTPEKLGDVAVMRLDLGRLVPAIDYIHAQRLRIRMRDAFRALFQTFDVILGPAKATRAGSTESPKAGPWTTPLQGGQEIDMWKEGPEYSGIYNLVGIPAIVIPAGFSSEGTPIGLQLAAQWFDEADLLRVAHAYEQATDWHRQRPPCPPLVN